MNDDPEMENSTEKFEKAVRNDSANENYVLRLFVSGLTPGSLKAIQNIKRICREHFGNRYKLEVIDVYQQPELVKDEQVVATPTLIKKLPPPLRKFIGDLSDTDKILMGMDVYSDKSKETKS